MRIQVQQMTIEKLNINNYKQMERKLEAKNKFGFMNDSIKKLDDTNKNVVA